MLSGLVMLTVAGCGPKQLPLVAVYVDPQSTPQALMRQPCDDDGRVRSPELRGTRTQPSATDPSPTEEPWIGWDAPGSPEAADFPVFAPPAAWAAETRGPQSLLPGYTYELSFADPDDSYVYNGLVSFTADDLARLAPGQVLTLKGAMPREAFEDTARAAAC